MLRYVLTPRYVVNYPICFVWILHIFDCRHNVAMLSGLGGAVILPGLYQRGKESGDDGLFDGHIRSLVCGWTSIRVVLLGSEQVHIRRPFLGWEVRRRQSIQERMLAVQTRGRLVIPFCYFIYFRSYLHTSLPYKS